MSDLLLGEALGEEVGDLPARVGPGAQNEAQELQGGFCVVRSSVRRRLGHAQLRRRRVGAANGMPCGDEGRASSGSGLAGERSVDGPDADPEPPVIAAHQGHDDVDDRERFLRDSLDLVASRAVEGAKRFGTDGLKSCQGGRHEVRPASTAALICRDDKRGRTLHLVS